MAKDHIFLKPQGKNFCKNSPSRHNLVRISRLYMLQNIFFFKEYRYALFVKFGYLIFSIWKHLKSLQTVEIGHTGSFVHQLLHLFIIRNSSFQQEFLSIYSAWCYYFCFDSSSSLCWRRNPPHLAVLAPQSCEDGQQQDAWPTLHREDRRCLFITYTHRAGTGGRWRTQKTAWTFPSETANDWRL